MSFLTAQLLSIGTAATTVIHGQIELACERMIRSSSSSQMHTNDGGRHDGDTHVRRDCDEHSVISTATIGPERSLAQFACDPRSSGPLGRRRRSIPRPKDVSYLHTTHP